MKRVFLRIISLFLIFSLCACSSSITDGEVYEKEYKESYTTVIMLPLAISNGKTTTTTLMPYFVHYPDRYVIYIKKYNGEKWIKEDFYVSKEVYDQINVGDMFEYDKNRGDLKEEPYTKEKKTGSDTNDRYRNYKGF